MGLRITNINFLANIGRVILSFLAQTGRLSQFAWTSVSHCLRPPFYPAMFFSQLMRIGYFSLPVVGLTAISTVAAASFFSVRLDRIAYGANLGFGAVVAALSTAILWLINTWLA